MEQGLNDPSNGCVRVAVVRHGPFFADPRVSKEAMALAEEPGVTVEVFTRGPDVSRWASHPDLKVIRLTRSRPSDRPTRLAVQALRFGLNARRRIRQARTPFDVVIVHSIPSWLALLLIHPRRNRAPRLILDHHEPEAEMLREAGLPRVAAALARAFESLSIRSADGVVDVSPEMATRTARLGAKRQIVVDNSPVIVPSSTAVSGPELDLAVFGSLIERYDLPTLREALSLVERPIDVCEIGRGPAQLRDNPSGGALLRRSPVPPPELQAALRRCRFGFVGLHPSGFTDLVSPNRLFELAGLGIPAVVARTPITTRLMGPFAVYYHGGSTPSLRDALSIAASMTETERRRLGEGARRRLAPRSWEAQSGRFVQFCLDGAIPIARVAI